jgi:hypothetical protein
MRALKAGARAYLLRDSAAADLIGAIEAVSQGKSFFSPIVSRILAEDYVRVLKEKSEIDNYELLNLDNSAELVVYAVRKGLIS